MIDTTKLVAKPGGSRFAPSGAVTDRILLEIASQYETTVSRKMTAIKPEEFSRRFPGTEPILETTKYDGEGVFVYYEDGKEPFTFNAYSGRVRLGLPALSALQQQLKQQNVRKGLFRAELYLPDFKDGRRSGIADVIRVSFSGTEADLARLRLVMLDVIMLDGKDLRPNQEHFKDAWQLLDRLFGPPGDRPFHRAEGSIVPENQVENIFTTRTKTGQEGLVLRRLNRADLIKVKPHLTVDAAVVGYVEGEFEGQFGVTSILTALTYPQRQDGVLFQTFARVGSGLTDAQRLEFRDVFGSVKTDAPIAMTDSDGRTVNFVKPKYLVELEGDDLLLTGGSERENRTQLFNWNSDRFRFLGLTACPRLTFPIFAKLRSDKDLESGGARLEQVVKNPLLPALEKAAPEKPQILRREVYAKAEAMRKLVVVRQPAENSVPYLVYWTDYSAKRKDPLKVSSSFAFTEGRAHALAEKLLAEGVTRGFIRTDGASSPTAEAASEAAPAKPKRAKKAKTQE